MNATLTPITGRVSHWPGVETDATREGVTFRVGTREFAHLSSRGDLTVPTSPALRDQLLTDGFADGVPRTPDRVRYRVRSAADVTGAIRLVRVAYLQHGGVPGERLDDDHLRRLGASPELAALLVGSPASDAPV
ncbi:hypothetical protein C2R22_09095 [Salinigranum rubrum]|uniref:Luciferase domain-containing protein n=1 Tax=Salinigranum rubrum TaxID=755307 RepID=A0A2I8VIM3_9EURY|nr:luciferase family protein [Salinigranum rubrum]AUV81786.1 hypothetical protein C2R22_09095 [Salinigranum rubrum]